MQFSTTMKQGNSKQEWLANVQVCPCCQGQQPKATFKRVDGRDICLECQEDLVELTSAQS
jgi:recombinational DNA repair protein (RecF pathway)